MKYLKYFESFSSSKDLISYVYYTIEEFDGNNFEIIEKDIDYDTILKEFENLEPSYSDLSPYDKPTYQLVKYKDYYKFVYELDEDESLDDYSIEDYLDDSYYYKKIDSDESEVIDTMEFDSENTINDKKRSKISDIKLDVELNIMKKFKEYIHYEESAGFLKKSTYMIFLINNQGEFVNFDKDNIIYSVDVSSSEGDVYDIRGNVTQRSNTTRKINFDDDSLSVFRLRISDHSQNIENTDDIIESSLSFVICYENETKDSFEHEKDYHEEDIYDISGYFSDIELDDDNSEYVDDITMIISKEISNQPKYYNRFHK